jgi:hypothetical protein
VNRDELERLDRDALVGRAEEAGVTRARVLTRPELVDELLLRSTAVDDATRRRARGLFGRARDLIARVVERGLNLPDAAERIRALGLAPPPLQQTAPAALPTVTLAQIYMAQGHRAKAIDTLQKVLAREADHAVAANLLAKLGDAGFPVPAPVLPPEEEVAPAPAAEVDAEANAGSPDDGGNDECVAELVAATAVNVSWRVRKATLDHARQKAPGARMALCLHVVQPTWDGPRPTTRCYDVDGAHGEMRVGDLAQGCVVRAAVGWLEGERFAAFAHSGAMETAAQ